MIDHQKNQQPLNVIIKSIQDVISEHYKIDDLKLPLSGIIGVSNYPEHGKSGQLLINRAQIALHHAKINHHKWEYFESTSTDKANYLLKLASDMKDALENKDFEIYHQPQIDLKTLRVCGSECLIRWNHKTEGFIPPSVFIPVAEDIGLINPLTLWIVKKSLEQHQTIIENEHKNHMVSINISGKDLASKHFYDGIVDSIKQSSVPPEKIIFELTESATITDSKHALEVIEQLNGLGITLSIDDFGTGYSSMSYISELPFQELKVDRQFVENVCDSTKRKTIAETTVKMGKGLGLEVVAEGINSQLDEDTLRSFGCDIGQGHFYAEAMPIMNYIAWLNEQKNGRKDVVHGVFIPAEK